MGQIIGSAAKPKRCNANQLSQVPTPAAGEHILVSSDNSMNAAGQGDFDCYIVGNGTKAATALELKPIIKDLYALKVTGVVLEQGAMNSDGTKSPQEGSSVYDKRVRTETFVKINGTAVLEITAGYNYNIFYYNSDSTSSYVSQEGVWLSSTEFVINWNGYIMVGIKKSNGATLVPSDVTLSLKSLESLNINERLGNIEEYNVGEMYSSIYGDNNYHYNFDPEFEQGAMTTDGQKSPQETSDVYDKRVRTPQPVRVYGNFTIKIEDGYQCNVFYYTNSNLSSYVSQEGAWLSGTLNLNWDGYIMIGCKNTGGSQITPSEVDVTLEYIGEKVGLIEEVNNLSEQISDNEGYFIDASMLKRNVKTNNIGTLTYLQAFCIYDGKYYSTNGSNIAEQDSDFSVLRNVSINLGHGNSLQLGNNGMAWASGWNDNKVYKVNLSTLSVSDTITLPTTGYTTAAIDELNHIAYIFQRDSYPSTEANYNFIVYDYQNNNIISTKIIESFAAMQACELYQGKIIVLYGLGTAVAPSGMRVYNTNGDVIGEYVLDVFQTTEPEGVCIKRDTQELYVSEVNKNLYKLS